MNIKFPNKTVLVTGAAHGFGRAISLAFAARGAQVWACDLLAEELKETQQQCNAAGGRCQVQTVDITDPQAVQSFIERAISEAGRIDILVNNAGGVLGQVGRALETVSPEDWSAILATNVSGAFYFCQHVAPGMKASRWGRIINISSGAGLTYSLTGIQAYAASKAALIGLTRQLAHELGAWNITVNCIAPGFVRSNPTTERQWESYGKEGQRALVESIPLKRLGTSEDIAHGVLFFASDYAAWITGQILSVDGGKIMR